MSEYYKKIEKKMYFDTSILCLGRAILFQELLLPVEDWYEQCVCVGGWAKHGVCRQQKALLWRWEEEVENKERQFEELKQ